MSKSQSLPDDVPSPIDFRNMSDAQTWTAAAMLKRPVRYDGFKLIVEELLSAHCPGNEPFRVAQCDLLSHPIWNSIERVLRPRQLQ